ncbi:GNAT family N-acetyltransferase [Enterococcus rivorum]|uniref:N-acetyltransferase domain-containing protein n=1 Tax=Enterococcus rivorum TaxID=762845 RepID=A0A1E5KUB7_9ENTE|nr:GNAT family N-acetyltransferase [Enterococcus rivorum]MBP2098913.1 ribosomal protein S18 acetylase RimI-like enzyme [Enterococcus rivorum]OEH81484.1 hypothetical protein BCR26_04365 [Enterococcus rivorum]
MFEYKKYKSIDSKVYKDSLVLRNDLLRVPIQKSIYDENLDLEKGNDFYGVFKDGNLIGTLSFFEREPFVAQLTAFAISKEFQRLGLGKKLVVFLLTDLKSRGYHKISVNARTSAKEFYQKCGFAFIEGPILNSELGVEDYRMEYLIEK